METKEAFRISIGKAGLELLVSDHHDKELGLQSAVEQVLKPLKLLNRLHFYRLANPADPMDWLVVKIESSAQLPLLGQDNQSVFFDAELGRECDAAEEVVRGTLALFRKLVALSKMSPVQFHNILQSSQNDCATGLKMMRVAEEIGDGLVAMRNPAGQDTLVKSYPIPRMITLPDVQEEALFVHMVGTKSALVYRSNGDGDAPKPVGRRIELFWGNVPSRLLQAQLCFSAMNASKAIKVRIRETRNRRGVVCRLEWQPNPDLQQY